MDIYFLEEYGKLYENIESGEFVQFIHKSEYGEIQHNFIKRPIKQKVFDEVYYDLITPYGYGGPIITKLTGEVNDLTREFEIQFSKYCEANNIVAEFIRFHPIIENHLPFVNVYDVHWNRKTALSIIEKGVDNFQRNFSKTARKIVRKNKKKLSYDIVDYPTNESLMVFKKIYKSTMNRNNANDYYYFDDYYFSSMLDNLSKYFIIINVYYDNIAISSAIYFVFDNYMHAHLSGTLSNYLNLSPAYLIKYAATKFAEENSLHYIHHGGGITSSETDSLLEFKQKFSNNNTSDFYIGKKIYNNEIYQKLIDITDSQTSDFFPQYRDIK